MFQRLGLKVDFMLVLSCFSFALERKKKTIMLIINTNHSIISLVLLDSHCLIWLMYFKIPYSLLVELKIKAPPLYFINFQLSAKICYHEFLVFFLFFLLCSINSTNIDFNFALRNINNHIYPHNSCQPIHTIIYKHIGFSFFKKKKNEMIEEFTYYI